MIAKISFGTLLKPVLVTLLFCTLIACTFFSRQPPPNLYAVNTASLSQLESVYYPIVQGSTSTSTASPTSLSSLRIKMLQDSAMSLGAQGGLAYASEDMNKRMERDGKYLDTIFNFYAMVLSHGILPPVLEEGDFSLNLADPNTIRVADKTYKIIQQARFATTPPTWREYLWLAYTKPELPDRTLLPRDACEQKIWKQAVRAGWKLGIEQGYSIFQQNLARLKRDYHGMVIYRELLQKKMISPPFVARTELGVTGDGGDMRINDQVLRIVELPQLQTNSRSWRAVVVKR